MGYKFRLITTASLSESIQKDASSLSKSRENSKNKIGRAHV